MFVGVHKPDGTHQEVSLWDKIGIYHSSISFNCLIKMVEGRIPYDLGVADIRYDQKRVAHGLDFLSSYSSFFSLSPFALSVLCHVLSPTSSSRFLSLSHSLIIYYALSVPDVGQK